MAQGLLEEKSLQNIAEAIRKQNKETELYYPRQMAEKILELSHGTDTSDATATAEDILKDKTAYVNGEKIIGTYEGQAILQDKDVTITENGQSVVTADEGFDGLGKVNISVNTATKKFATIEEMNADPNKEVGDIAIVLSTKKEGIKEDTVYQRLTFPDTIILDKPAEEYVRDRVIEKLGEFYEEFVIDFYESLYLNEIINTGYWWGYDYIGLRYDKNRDPDTGEELEGGKYSFYAYGYVETVDGETKDIHPFFMISYVSEDGINFNKDFTGFIDFGDEDEEGNPKKIPYRAYTFPKEVSLKKLVEESEDYGGKGKWNDIIENFFISETADFKGVYEVIEDNGEKIYTPAYLGLSAKGRETLRGKLLGKFGVEDGTLQNVENINSTELRNKVEAISLVGNIYISSEETNLDDLCIGNENLVIIPRIVCGNNITSLYQTFARFNGISIDMTGMDTTNVTTIGGLFSGDTNLIFVNGFKDLVLNSVTNCKMAFSGCKKLNNDMLNDILEKCTTMTLVDVKTLKDLGLTEEQVEICKTLPNYELFSSSDWVTGYDI